VHTHQPSVHFNRFNVQIRLLLLNLWWSQMLLMMYDECGGDSGAMRWLPVMVLMVEMSEIRISSMI
jgi:hypothetical protein